MEWPPFRLTAETSDFTRLLFNSRTERVPCHLKGHDQMPKDARKTAHKHQSARPAEGKPSGEYISWWRRIREGILDNSVTVIATVVIAVATVVGVIINRGLLDQSLKQIRLLSKEKLGLAPENVFDPCRNIRAGVALKVLPQIHRYLRQQRSFRCSTRCTRSKRLPAFRIENGKIGLEVSPRVHVDW
jgi:hypothetical protein